jgi:hypothetical protein
MLLETEPTRILLLSSGCAYSNCWKNHHVRDHNLDIVVGIVAIFLLLVGVMVICFSSFGCFSIGSAPDNMDMQSSYERATVVFSRLFLHPDIKANLESNKDLAPQVLQADVQRQKRSLTDSTLTMDLSEETNIFYSATVINNNVIAQKDHLEYDFGSSSEVETLAKQFLQLSFLPTILEASPANSFSSISAMLQDDRRRKNHVPRKIVLFSGPEEKRHWLVDDDDDFNNREALWNFQDDYSDDEERFIG